MENEIRIIIRKSTRTGRHPLLLGILAAGTALLALAQDPHADHQAASPASLVQAVRTATGQFTNVNAAIAAGYQPLFGCVSGPDQGAMGIHYINLALYAGGKLDVGRPQALIYEPSNGGLTLVGVEYIADAATWLAHNGAPPMLDGQAFLLVNSPNRYGLSAFFELHVWAWRDSPNGAFVDWNTRVSCEGQ
jgi:hypothetical protein